MKTWRSRLTSKLNLIHQKLYDFSLTMNGNLTDIIRIKEDITRQFDYKERILNGIDIINIIFPPIKDLPQWRFYRGGGYKPSPAMSNPDSGGVLNTIECYAPIFSDIDQNDLIIKYFFNESDESPLLLVMQVRDIQVTYGDSRLAWKKLIVGFYDEFLSSDLLEVCQKMATRRYKLGW